jgi:3-aminobutyryl-CoA ammonia-lyase
MTAAAGQAVTHRRYVPASHAHYGGKLVDGAYVLGLFGDVGTELSIRSDGDEGLFASYSDVQFRAPVLAGDVIEATATVIRAGRHRSTVPPPPGCWPSPWWWSPRPALWWCRPGKRPLAR